MLLTLLEDRGVRQGLDVRGLGWRIHLAQNLLGKGLFDLVKVAATSGLSDSSSLSLGQLLNVAVHGVL